MMRAYGDGDVQVKCFHWEIDHRKLSEFIGILTASCCTAILRPFQRFFLELIAPLRPFQRCFGANSSK